MRCVWNTQNTPCGFVPTVQNSLTIPVKIKYKQGVMCKEKDICPTTSNRKFGKICNHVFERFCCVCNALSVPITATVVIMAIIGAG